MGIYVNPGNTTFRKLIHSDLYVDKTNLISAVNKSLGKIDCFLCVSRPRRFGKSMAADMLVAYYSKGCDSRELFAGLNIEQDSSFGIHLNQHPVIRFDVQQFLFQKSHWDIFIERIQEVIIKELQIEYGNCFELDSYGLQSVLNQIYVRTGQGFVFIIDEWDCVFRLAKENQGIQKKYLDFLRGLFKGTEYVDLVYMTGILPIKKYGEHTSLNIFEEYSMVGSEGIASFFGFTEEEVRTLCLEKKR